MAAMRTDGIDAWASVVWSATVWNILGLDQLESQMLASEWIIASPLLIASGLVFFARRLNLSESWQWVGFLLGIFGPQLVFLGSQSGMKQFGYGVGFFVWTIVLLTTYVQSQRPVWLVGALLSGLLTLAWRHTAGFVLLLCLSSAVIFLAPIQKTPSIRHVRIGMITAVVIIFLHSFFIFEFISKILVSGLSQMLLLIVKSGGSPHNSGSEADVAMISAPQSDVTITATDLLTIGDHLLVGLMVGSIWIVCIWAIYCRDGVGESHVRVVMLYAALAFGLIPTVVGFYLYQGPQAVFFRFGQYLSVFFLFAPIVAAVVGQRWDCSIPIRRVAVVGTVLVLVIGPTAALATDATERSSGYLTFSERSGVQWTSENIPENHTVVGTYHAATPVAGTHDSVIGPSIQQMGHDGVAKIIAGLYHDPGHESTPAAVRIFESEFSQINRVDIIVTSSQASGEMGITARAGRVGVATENYSNHYPPGYNRIYSSGEYRVTAR